MNHQINLTSKILGMISIVSGISGLIFIAASIIQIELTISGAPHEKLMEPIIIQVSINLIIACIIHILIGLYLLKDNNRLVRLALPKTHTWCPIQNVASTPELQTDYSQYSKK